MIRHLVRAGIERLRRWRRQRRQLADVVRRMEYERMRRRAAMQAAVEEEWRRSPERGNGRTGAGIQVPAKGGSSHPESANTTRAGKR